jgi:hypothetical protein
MQVAKTTGITAADFRADMAERWQRLTVRTGGTLFKKKFIPFEKEGDIGDYVMTIIIQQQTAFLSTNNQCIVQNLNGIDFSIDITTCNG